MKHHIEILRFLQASGSVSSRDLARQVGVSVGAVDDCVKALRDWGFGISDLLGTGYQLTESLQLVESILTGEIIPQRAAPDRPNYQRD